MTRVVVICSASVPWWPKPIAFWNGQSNTKNVLSNRSSSVRNRGLTIAILVLYFFQTLPEFTYLRFEFRQLLNVCQPFEMFLQRPRGNSPHRFAGVHHLRS